MPTRAAPTHRPWRGLLAALLCCTACGSADPLEAARRSQDVHGDPAGPLESLRELVEERPGDAEVQYRYGLALLASNQPALALWPLQRAAESEAWRERAGLALASAHMAAGAFDKAVAAADGLIEDDPENTLALLVRANARIQGRRDYEGALADAERVLELAPENTDALPARAIALLALDRVEEAALAIDELDSLHRDDALGLHGSPGYCTARAKFAEEKGEVDVAEQRYDACLEQFPADANVVSEAMALHDGLGRAERSNEILRAALDEAPQARHYRLALAGRLRAQERFEEAEAVLREGTEHADPLVAAEAWAGLAQFQMDAGDYDEAIGSYEQARRLAGSDDLLLFSTADALVIAGRLDEAVELAGQIGVPAYRELVLGRAALARDEPARALEHFEAGIRLWPDNPFARYYAAVASEQVGDFERAVEDYRYSMRASVHATDGYLRLARLQRAAGHPELALSALQFNPGGRPFEREAALLELEILSAQGRAGLTPPRVMQQLEDPAERGAVAAALAAGVRSRLGAEEAAAALRSVEGLELTNPAHAEALAALVALLAEQGKPGEALAEVERALRAHPEAAIFHALRGRALALRGETAPARAAYQRALELDAELREGLVGLAELERESGGLPAAQALYERALALDEDDAKGEAARAHAAAARGHAAVLAALERGGEAEAQLAELLRDRPYDTEAALALAELRLARGASDARTRELARRAVFFGGGEPAERLVERLGEG